MDRKDFLHKAVRISIAGAFTAIAGVAILKQLRGNCTNISSCKICNELAHCDLPEALKYKRDGEKQKN